MYTVYADKQLIHSPLLADEGRIIFDATYEKEINKSGTFQFGIYDTNPFYEYIKPLKTIIVVKENDKIVWFGRALSYEKNFDNLKTVSCEGAMSFFNDILLDPFNHTKNLSEQLNYILTKYNNMADVSKQVTLKEITVTDLYGNREWTSSEYVTVLSLIENILSDYGGYLLFEYDYELSKTYISYIEDPGKKINQKIEFGSNLLDMTLSIDPENIFTVLVPIGYDSNGNRITIETVNQGKNYIISEESVDIYGIVMYCHTFNEDIVSPQDLLNKAIQFLNNNSLQAVTLEINAVDLHLINNNLESIDIYDVVEVHSLPHKINSYEMCTRVSVDIQSPDNSEYIIGPIPKGIVSYATQETKTSQSSGGGGGSSLPDGDSIQY